MPKLSADHRRALELLAGSDGCTEALMMAHGFTGNLLAALILDGLTSADGERMMAGGKVVEVRRSRITDARRVAVER
jgi:hypothetical protein